MHAQKGRRVYCKQVIYITNHRPGRYVEANRASTPVHACVLYLLSLATNHKWKEIEEKMEIKQKKFFYIQKHWARSDTQNRPDRSTLSIGGTEF